jgi:predicted RNA-binding Zn ribbon-like protein
MLTEDDGAAQPLFVDFVNTLHWYEGEAVELLGDDAALSGWLAEHALPAAPVGALPALPALRALREHARAVTEALAAGRALGAADVEAVAGALARPSGRLVLAGDAGRPQLAFALDDERAAAAFQIALSLTRFLESGERQRLKLCANPDCDFAFLDTSTNGTRRWCYMRACGNRLKARAFRRRRAERLESPPPPASSTSRRPPAPAAPAAPAAP